MSTQKGIVSIIFGTITTLIGTIFQFILMYLLIDTYNANFNGFVKNTIVFVSFLGGIEGGIGVFCVLFLLKPLIAKDWVKANEILNSARKQYKISGIATIVLLILIAVAYSIYTFYFNNLTVNNLQYPLWKMFIIIILIGSKNILALFWTAAYENLMQADQNNYVRRIVLIICDLLVYAGVFYSITWSLDPIYIFLSFLLYSIIKGILISFYIKINYPWIVKAKGKNNKILISKSNYVALKNIGEILIINSDLIAIALFLGLQISTSMYLYMTIASGVRTIMLLLINSFREFFATWISKNGRISWNSYVKFETYAFIIAGFLFINQFILSPYFVNVLYGKIITQDFGSWTEQTKVIYQNIFFYPNFSLIVALSSVFLVIAEPANVLIYGKGKYQETYKAVLLIGITNLILNLFLAAMFVFVFDNILSGLYSLLICTCVFTFIRFLYFWVYNWIYLTYSSTLKGVINNWIVLLVPILVAVLVNYLFLKNDYSPISIYQYDSNGTIVSILWTWKKLISFFLGITFSSIGLLLANSLIWAPESIKGIVLRLPIIYFFSQKKAQKNRDQRQKLYQDDFNTFLAQPDSFSDIEEKSYQSVFSWAFEKSKNLKNNIIQKIKKKKK